MAANFPTLYKLAPRVTFEHQQGGMPTSFLGENKSYFSLFSSLDGENQDPVLNSTFSSLALKKNFLKTNLSKFPPCFPSYIF